MVLVGDFHSSVSLHWRI